MKEKSKVYLHSPLCPTDFTKDNNRALLLALILKELARKTDIEEYQPQLLPFDWAVKPTPTQKLTEFLSLLPFAFPHLDSLVPNLFQSLHLPPEAFVSLLEPFILEQKSSETVLIFLIQHQNKLALKPLLDKISPEGIHILKEDVKNKLRNRGYPFAQWTDSPKRF